MSSGEPSSATAYTAEEGEPSSSPPPPPYLTSEATLMGDHRKPALDTLTKRY